MDKGVGVFRESLSLFIVKVFLVHTAVGAFSVFVPCVGDFLKEDVAVFIWEVSNGVLAIGTSGAVETTAAHVGGKLCDAYAIELVVHDVVYTLLQVWDLAF